MECIIEIKISNFKGVTLFYLFTFFKGDEYFKFHVFGGLTVALCFEFAFYGQFFPCFLNDFWIEVSKEKLLFPDLLFSLALI